MSFETDLESKNGLDTGSTETVSRYSTTLQGSIANTDWDHLKLTLYAKMLISMDHTSGFHCSSFVQEKKVVNFGWSESADIMDLVSNTMFGTDWTNDLVYSMEFISAIAIYVGARGKEKEINGK